jgi:hypothetical protein
MPVLRDRFPKGQYQWDPTKTIKTGANLLPGKTFPGPKTPKELIEKVHARAKTLAEKAGIQRELKKQEMANQAAAEISRLRGYQNPIVSGMRETRIHHLRKTLGYQ